MKGAVVMVGLLVVLCIVAFAGVPQGGGFSWDNGPTIERIKSHERLEAQRIAARNEADARAAETWRLFFLVAGGVVVVAVATRYGYLGVVRLIDYWQHRTDKQTEVMLAALPILARRPGAYLARVGDEWCVVDDARQELVPVARRLPEQV